MISRERCRRRIEKLSRGLLIKYRARDPSLSKLLRDVEIYSPSVTFPDRLSVQLDGDLQVDLIHPGERAHTDGDTMVLVKEEGALFAGDVLWVGYHPNLEDASVKGQVQALRKSLGFEASKDRCGTRTCFWDGGGETVHTLLGRARQEEQDSLESGTGP